MKGRGLLQSHGRGQKGIKNLLNDQKKLWLEEYKELGLEFRHLDSQVSATNRLMLPPLVIGLLVLYGKVNKFFGVEFNNPEAAHHLIWLGCFIISLIWVFNVSRLAQLVHSHLETRRENEPQLGLSGHTKIYNRDKTVGVRKILRHNILRLIGFGIYFSLLLLKLKSMNFHGVPILHEFMEWDILWASILVSVGLPVWIWYAYFYKLHRSSRATPTDIWDIKRRKFLDIKRQKLLDIKKWIFDLIIPIIIFLGIFAILILFFVNLQQRPDANVYLVGGLESFAKGEYDNSIKDFNKAIALDPNNPGAYFNRGSAYYHKEDFASAIIDFDKVIALDSNNSDARAFRSEAQRKLESSDKQ